SGRSLLVIEDPPRQSTRGRWTRLAAVACVISGVDRRGATVDRARPGVADFEERLRDRRVDAAVDQADGLEELLADGDVGAEELVRRLVGLQAVVVVER
ncbi:MAG: hypothetical protein K0S82_1833, partial [Gaiellaceae bacterium]|nr:hypothetical protein [Gaiellaceae bacterium]